MSTRRATRSDVAKLAGTSVAVVSYVVNDGPRPVSRERRERVLEAMRTLKYQPNAIARSLTSTRTNTIGMIIPNISNAYFAELALAVEDAAAEVDRLVFLGNSNEERAREAAYVESFLRQRVDAVVIIGVARSTSIRQLLDAGVRVVVVDRSQGDEDVVNVGLDHVEAGRLATEHLVWHGHQRIACLTGPEGLPVADERLHGWQQAMTAAGLDPTYGVHHSEFSLEGGRAAMHEIRRRDPDATALFVASDEQARGVLAAADGMSVPSDLAIVSIDGTRQANFTSPPLATVRQPLAAIASAAIAAAIDSTGANHDPVLVHGELVPNRSCGCGG